MCGFAHVACTCLEGFAGNGDCLGWSLLMLLGPVSRQGMGQGSCGLLVLLWVPASEVYLILVCGYLRFHVALRHSTRLVAYWQEGPVALRICLGHHGRPVQALRLGGYGRLVLDVGLGVWFASGLFAGVDWQ